MWILVVFCALLAPAFAGCGMVYPRTVIGPPVFVGQDRDERVFGGSDTTETETIVIEVPSVTVDDNEGRKP
jgi:hypothetical protein